MTDDPTQVHVTRHSDITDHLHFEIEGMDSVTFEQFADEVLETANEYGEVVFRDD